MFGGYFDLDSSKEKIKELELELEVPSAWDNPNRASKLNKELTYLKDTLEHISIIISNIEDSIEILEMLKSEFHNIEYDKTLKDLKLITSQIEDLEFKRMFNSPEDKLNAYLDINSGSGGTEAQDWAAMLLRMYLRWGEDHGFVCSIEDSLPGEVAGIKNATIKFKGSHGYGWLKTESGVHRLVRKSPFDSSNKRHTSFASVFVSPEIEDDFEVKISTSDIRIDTYRASGAGGQHVNRTDSAVRITHIPTSIVVQCQSDRSQHKNKAQAMKQLKSKLYQLEISKRFAEKQSLEQDKSLIGWGNQIRSYVLDSSRIKDLRTGVETGNTTSVLDGDIDQFIKESLKQRVWEQ